MNAKFIRIVIILLFGCMGAYAQGRIIGRVFSEADHTPIDRAIIYIEDLRIGALTDSEGAYTINYVPDGTYLVSVKILGYTELTKRVKVNGTVELDFPLSLNVIRNQEVVITGNSAPKNISQTPQPITYVSSDYLNETSSTNVIDAISKVPGVSGITDGQSITKPVIRGLGYNRVLTIADGVEQMDQQWFDEFGIEVDPNAVQHVEILKGPASLSYGSDAIAGVVNLIPEAPLPEGKDQGDVLFNYQTNNGLIDNMVHLAGTNNGISWSGRIDNIMAHAYHDPADGYVLNSQFSNFNMDGTIGIHRKWGFSQIHASYFDMATGIIDGTRDSAGNMLRQVSYPDLNGGAPTYEVPTKQELTSYTPLVINQRIRHTKVVWDNSVAVGEGRITGTFSYQRNQRQETNDPTQPNTPDIYYLSNAATYDLKYISKQYGGFNFSAGINGAYQDSKSLGTVQLIPNYNFIEGGAFAIANYQVGRLSLAGGVRYDVRRFTAGEGWIDTTHVLQAPVPANTPGSFEEFVPFTTNYGGLSASLGGTYNFEKGYYIKLNAAKGYRAPNVTESAAYGVHDGTFRYEIGTPGLKPESNYQVDMTLGANLKDVSIEASVFNNYIENFIYAKLLYSVNGGDSLSNLLSAGGALFPDAPVYKYTQGTADLYGGEAVLDVHPRALPWVDLYSTLSVVQGGLLNVPDSLKALAYVPPTRLTVDLKFHIKKIGKWMKNPYVDIGTLTCFQQINIYKQDPLADGFNPQSTPFEYYASRHATAGYTLLNAGIGGDIQSHGRTLCKIYVYGTNLTNEIYMDYMSRFKYLPVNYATDRVGVFNMGRNISIKMIIPFDFSKQK